MVKVTFYTKGGFSWFQEVQGKSTKIGEGRATALKRSLKVQETFGGQWRDVIHLERWIRERGKGQDACGNSSESHVRALRGNYTCKLDFSNKPMITFDSYSKAKEQVL